MIEVKIFNFENIKKHYKYKSKSSGGGGGDPDHYNPTTSWGPWPRCDKVTAINSDRCINRTIRNPNCFRIVLYKYKKYVNTVKTIHGTYTYSYIYLMRINQDVLSTKCDSSQTYVNVYVSWDFCYYIRDKKQKTEKSKER